MKLGVEKKINIFRKYFTENRSNTRGLQEDLTISRCMNELYHILEAGYTSTPEPQSTIHFSAILGASGRLIEALLYSKESSFQCIFNKKFLVGVRSTIYHAQGPFSHLCVYTDPKILNFFSHLYDHCRKELCASLNRPIYLPLSREIDYAEREQEYFRNTIDYSMQDHQMRVSKIKPKILERLERNVKLLNDMIKFLSDNTSFLVNRDGIENEKRSNIVRASAIATQTAWIGLDASSLLKGDFYLNETDEETSALAQNERGFVQRKYKEYIKPGIRYRHEHAELSQVLENHHISAIRNNQPIIELELIYGIELVKFARIGSLLHVEYFCSQLTLTKNVCAGKALVHAAEFGQREVVLWLLEKSSIVFNPNILIIAIENAAKNRHMNIIQPLVAKSGFEIEGLYEWPKIWDEHEKPAEMLLLRNLHINAQSPAGYTSICMPYKDGNDGLEEITDQVNSIKMVSDSKKHLN